MRVHHDPALRFEIHLSLLMGILDRFKSAFVTNKTELLDVSARFRLDRHPFTGTMSRFHMATEIATGRIYGIKLLDSEKLALFRNRFRGLDRPEEGEIGMRINHPHVARTYEYGKTTTGIEYILMEFVDGPGVNTLIRDKNPTYIENRLRLIRQAALAIQAVHDAGFIHRDICPRNFICEKSLTNLKLIDFGLSLPNEPPFRLPGNRTGTPQYMAPEIVRRRPTDRRVDVFAYGVTLYKMLTTYHPWGTKITSGLAPLVHDQKPPTPITDYRPDLDPRLGRAIHRCLEVYPENRMESCRMFLTSIRDVEKESV